MSIRYLTEEERTLIKGLLEGNPNSETIVSKLSTLEVEDMSDGGMGSIRFVNKEKKQRSYGSTLTNTEVVDEDNIPISIAINLDTDGEIYELDIWKVDFSPLKRYPVI